MSKLMLVFMIVIVAGFLTAMALDSMVLAVCVVGYSILWAAFHLGDKLESR